MTVRKVWVRVLIVAVILLAIDIGVLRHDNMETMRRLFLTSLQSITVLFAITAAIAVAYLMNYARGIRSSYVDRVRSIRNHLWNFYEEYKDSENPEFRGLLLDTIFPLLKLNLNEWLHIENVKNWSSKIETEKITRLLESEPKSVILIYKYILPLEDEMNELGILSIRSVLIGLQRKVFKGVFHLAAVAMVILVVGAVIPNSLILDFVIINIISAIITLAIIELLWLISLVAQEVNEEFLEPSPETDEQVSQKK